MQEFPAPAIHHKRKSVIDNTAIHRTQGTADKRDGRSYFEPDSMIRRIHREAVVMLGGGRSILLQLAHPYVAAGVDDYSNFEAEILARLYRTIQFMHNLVYQDRDTARRALRGFHAMHERIRGRLGHRSGHLPPETRYSGRDPEAKLWVHATFVDTSLVAYQRFIEPLSADERRDYYTDTLQLARLMEIPEQIVPETYEEFQAYMERMISGESGPLAVTDTARRLADAVLYPDVGLFPALSAGLLRFVTAGLLPDRFSRAYGLKWDRSRQLVLDGMSRSSAFLRPYVPAWIWQNPLLDGKLTSFLLWGPGKPEMEKTG